jgi:hypothetical protein
MAASFPSVAGIALHNIELEPQPGKSVSCGDTNDNLTTKGVNHEG